MKLFGALLIFVVLCDTVLAAYVYWRFRKERTENPEFKLRFRITDIWALAIVLSPCMALMGIMSEQFRDPIAALLLGALIIPHQLGGIFLIRLVENSDETSQVTGNAWRSIRDIGSGALGGLGLPLFSGFVVVCAGIVIGTMPISLFIIILAVYLVRRVKRSREAQR